MEKKTQLSQDELIAQAVAQANKEFELKQQQRETNKVSIGGRIQELIIKKGSPIIDKATGQQKTNNDGIPQCYPDKFFVKIQAMGLDLETEVKEDIFENLQEHRTYLCEGHIGLVKKFGSDFIEPIFRKFTLI